ncbi:hypothetical protein VE03_01964 [Pseudogymnoascus sp. 23342-1-I1]|nr:hypothetical protein VE03_01964 [Pseudogymnoascus sp. 23342-1-I1]
MALRKLGGLFLLASVVSSMAIREVAPPVTLDEPLPCEYYGECIEVDIWGYRVQRLVNSSAAAIQGRADGRTKVDVGKDRIMQSTVAFQDDEPPAPVFKELWDRILEACYEDSCDAQHTITVGSYNLNVDGQFPSTTERNNFIDLIRQTFDQSKTSILEHSVIQQPGPGGGPGGGAGGGGSGSILQNTLTTSGVHFINANIFGGPNSGQHMTVHVTRSADGTSCPGVLSTIAAGGALVPGLSVFFGLIQVACTALAG